MVHTHPHVEDYIEIIAGYREPNGKSNYSIFTIGESPLSLARYDMKIIPSLAEQTIGGRGYTDKQAKLAAELVLKYERQLFKLGIDVAPVRTPVYRLPIREIDRETRAWVDNNTIKLKFPYNIELIDQARTASKESKGRIAYNRDTKLQELELTEWNVNWAYTFARANGFHIDSTLKDLMSLVLSAEKTSYAIELNYDNGQLTIANAATSLIEYIDQHLGGFGADNLMTLIDYAPILGYTVSTSMADTVVEQCGTRFWSLCANRELKVDPLTSTNLVKDLAEYARQTNRFPIYVYEADMSDRLLNEFTRFFPGQILRLGNQREDTITVDPAVRVIYTTKIPRSPVTGRIPLLISSAGMLFGGDRQIWIQTAEKIVYFTKDVYTKNSKGPEVCKLD
jgi:hypothetical protein